MIPNLATRNLTEANMMMQRVHSIAEIYRDDGANVKRHRQDLDTGPTRVAVVRVDLASSGDASGRHRGVVVALGVEGELQSQDVAALVAVASVAGEAVTATCVVSPRDADEMEGRDCEVGIGGETARSYGRVVDRVEGSVQEPVDAALEIQKQHVEDGGCASGSFVTEGQVRMLRRSHVLDLPAEPQSQGHAHTGYGVSGLGIDGVAELLGDLHGVAQGTCRQVGQNHTEKLLYCKDSMGSRRSFTWVVGNAIRLRLSDHQGLTVSNHPVNGMVPNRPKKGSVVVVRRTHIWRRKKAADAPKGGE